MKRYLNIKTPTVPVLNMWSALFVLPLTACTVTSETSSFSQAIKATKPEFNARIRYETVDQEGISESADALTYRLRGSFKTGEWKKFQLVTEFEHVQDIAGDFNSTSNELTQFPVIADPNVTELNRLQVSYKGLPKTHVTLGRQRINLDNQRFVGSVGWRQDDQTFDALRVENTSIKNLKLVATYIDKVNTIFGDDSPRGKRDSESLLLNAKFTEDINDTKLALTGFAYLLNFEQSPVLASQTYGARATYDTDRLSVQGSVAKQSDYGAQINGYSAQYYHAEFMYKHEFVNLGIGYENLTGDGQIGFATPLATLHKFNGFDDQFLGTPPDGLEDVYAKLEFKKRFEGPINSLAIGTIYHDFSSEGPSALTRVGNELDIVGTISFGDVKILTKYSDFKGKANKLDRQKFWLQLAYGF